MQRPYINILYAVNIINIIKQYIQNYYLDGCHIFFSSGKVINKNHIHPGIQHTLDCTKTYKFQSYAGFFKKASKMIRSTNYYQRQASMCFI